MSILTAVLLQVPILLGCVTGWAIHHGESRRAPEPEELPEPTLMETMSPAYQEFFAGLEAKERTIHELESDYTEIRSLGRGTIYHSNPWTVAETADAELSFDEAKERWLANSDLHDRVPTDIRMMLGLDALDDKWLTQG